MIVAMLLASWSAKDWVTVIGSATAFLVALDKVYRDAWTRRRRRSAALRERIAAVNRRPPT